MLLIYNFLLVVGFLILLPKFLLQAKYRQSLLERLGFLTDFGTEKVIWLHCVSVGETQAARPLVKALRQQLPDYKLVVSTTTLTGQQLAKKVFSNDAEKIFYFPFDLLFSVRRTLKKVNPKAIVLMETEIWLNLINEASKKGSKVYIVNARLSEKSFKRYKIISKTMQKILEKVERIVAQSEIDAEKFRRFVEPSKVQATANLKFDQTFEKSEDELTDYFRQRFGIEQNPSLILAASTHEPEEKWILEAFQILQNQFPNLRLMLVPRHPERFDKVAEMIRLYGYDLIRRSNAESIKDKTAKVILIDSIGELRSLMPLAQIVFIGGSLIKHGGQNILEAAICQKPIITGFYTMNFESIINEFLKHNAIIRLPELKQEDEIIQALVSTFSKLFLDESLRESLSKNAFSIVKSAKGASEKTAEIIAQSLR
ncbi:MAG: 3-deoxy-D-manno-octulosonic acid transferase [Pyrinomonadaceae bacterium]|nr:3-deoxy-D-manno-octulosonic acid transferase [Pyrinomonadaceae bacterium]MCX7639746.1 3-deoxy-D-manno-octulosonic acid transferase [Pyrinomonadaceae bacterium]MDW8304329.1 3-deoxy-D-manno-octulosonic acid transferase [Acidobacteriota bacterium]